MPKIKSWHQFQHFKDRRPPWIKLHRDILEQRDINMISDCSFRVLVGLWLLASEDKEMQGNLPSVDDIAFRLRMEKQKIINALEELGPFIEQDDIELISERYRGDDPETETETETETEERHRRNKPTQKFTPPAIEEVREYCRERGNEVDPQRFIDFYEAKGWMIGKNKMKDWKAAVRTWEKKERPQDDLRGAL